MIKLFCFFRDPIAEAEVGVEVEVEAVVEMIVKLKMVMLPKGRHQQYLV